MATVTARRRRAIEHLVATDFARDRLARAAFDVLADGLDLGPIAIRTPADRAWVRNAIAGPIQQAADHALDRLVDELIDTFAIGRPDLVARILAAAPDSPDLGPGFVEWRVEFGAPFRPASGDDGALPAVPDGVPARVAVLR